MVSQLPMKARLQRIEINNFKAFRQFSLDLDGRHLLLYGPNGSGKSSLYWAIYTFLQSGRKESISKYFDPDHDERLLNIHEDASAVPGQIALTIRDQETLADITYAINLQEHATKDNPVIMKAELASDFVTYRFFFGFSDFKNSQRFNIWPLFEREILPFCVSTSGANPLDSWLEIKSGKANPWSYKGRAGAQAYDSFRFAAREFATLLDPIVDSISQKSQEFYDQHFSSGDPGKLELQLKVTQRPEFTGTDMATSKFNNPILEFGIRMDGKPVLRPQSFLNEAKMTQLALSIRFAASLVNLHQSDIKLLVLDDLLVSLDMSNRMKVVEILLSAKFKDFQKIILTHELGLFQELRRHIGSAHHDWHFGKLAGNSSANPSINLVKTELECAEDFLKHDQLAECGNRLRKCAEEILENYLKALKAKTPHGHLVDEGKFTSLAQMIGEAERSLVLDAHLEFASLLESQYSEEEFRQVLSTERINPANITAADNQAKGRIIARIIAARPNMQAAILESLTEASRVKLNALRVITEVRKIKDRILNPASHAGVTPLYSKEAEDALEIVRKLQCALDGALEHI